MGMGGLIPGLDPLEIPLDDNFPTRPRRAARPNDNMELIGPILVFAALIGGLILAHRIGLLCLLSGRVTGSFCG